MHVINNDFLGNTFPYACLWEIKPSHRPFRLQEVKCIACNKNIRRPYIDLDKYVVGEGILPDMLYNDLIVSEKFRLAWLASDLKGIATFLPVPLYQRKNKRHVTVKQPYYHVVLNVPHLKVDIRKSRLIDDDEILANNGDEVIVPEGKHCWIYWQCPVCGYTVRSFSKYRDKRLPLYWSFPDNLVYDGTIDDDIFAFTNVFNGFESGDIGGKFFVVSDRFISFVKENKLTNVYALTPEEARLSQKGNPNQRFTPVYTDPSTIDV